MSVSTVRVVARIKAQPDKVVEVRRLLLSLVEPTRKEPGCVTYELLQNTEDPTDFTFIEEFGSDEAFKSHTASDNIRAIGPKLEPVVVEAPDIRTYSVVTED